MRRLFDLLFAGVDHACRALLLVLAVSVLWTVFGRYVLAQTPRWGEELALACLVWLSLLSVSLGVRGGYHIRLDLALSLSPRPVRIGAERVNWGLAVIVGGLFVWFGTDIAVLNLGSRMPGLGISAFWQYLAVPAGGVLILVALAERAWLGAPPAPAPTPEVPR